MNFHDPSMAGGDGEDPPSMPRKEIQLQGPRPAALQVHKSSYKILKKPPLPKPPKLLPAADDTNLRPQPVIIYAVSPKMIYADVNDFMNVVQRLTGGPSLSSDGLISAGDISPAARLASIENINNSPSDRNRGGGRNQNREADQVINLVDEEGLVETSQNQGILSPAPASLSLRIWAEFFSPAKEQEANSSSNYHSSVLNEFSPLLHGVSFISSPSILFSAPIFSPTLSLFDFDNF